MSTNPQLIESLSYGPHPKFFLKTSGRKFRRATFSVSDLRSFLFRFSCKIVDDFRGQETVESFLSYRASMVFKISRAVGRC